ncbi:unnamed protein product, partial [Laminaria digitata]
MTFRTHVRTLEEDLRSLLGALFPLAAEASELWSTPGEITELSWGVSPSGAVLFKYSCGVRTSEQDAYPHGVLCMASEWSKVLPAGSVGPALRGQLMNIAPDATLVDEEEYDEDEWNEAVEALTHGYRCLVVAAAFVRVLGDETSPWALSPGALRRVYEAVDEDCFDGRLALLEFEDYRDAILDAMAGSQAERQFLERVTWPSPSLGED